jgi:ATP-dependent DNA helicase RecG
MMIPNTIRKQILKGEGIGTEFKSSAIGKDAIARTVCSFLNTKGGTVFCGVDDKGKIVGIDDAQTFVADLQAFILSSISPKALFSVSADEENGTAIITIEVPRGKDGPYVYKGAVYVRRGSQTLAADSATLREMVQTKSVEVERWERRPAVGLEEEDFDHKEIIETVKEAEAAGRFTFSNPDDMIATLEDLAFCRTGGFTQAADVHFAKNPALRLPQVRVRATRFSEDKGSDDYLDDKVFQGPLVRVLNDVYDFIARNVAVTARFESDRIRRQDRLEYPKSALREGLVNAFAHRDYSGFSGGIAVGIYPSRIEIWNSGHLPEGLKPSDLRKNHPSLPTNPDIAHVLYIKGLMERVGRGTQKILTACKNYGIPAPKWLDRSSGVTLILYSVRVSADDQAMLNERQQTLLKALDLGDEITPAEYRKRFADNVSERQARRDLAGLDGLSLLTRIGGGAGTRYKRTNRT